MIAACMLSCLTATGMVFDIHEFPLASPSARTFIAESKPDGIADLFVLDGNELRFYEDALPENNLTIHFPPETSAVDLFDLDGDAQMEVIAIAGTAVLRYALAGENPGVAETLFTLEAIPPGFLSPPFLQSLATRDDRGVYLTLPGRQHLESFSLDGTALELTLEADDTRTPTARSWAIHPSSLVGKHGRELGFEYAWTPETTSEDLDLLAAAPSRSAGPYQLRQAAGDLAENWPWLPLRSGDATATGQRIHIAVEGNETGETLVRMRRPDAETAGGFRLGPVRRYPGQPLWPEDRPPDFNGDGYTDLLLWRTQAPAPTVNALSRAIAGGTWPVDLSIHLYEPTAASFSPRASGTIRVDTPISRFFDASPAIIPHAINLGFGSDGTRGLACATAETTFAVWRWQAGGLSSVPVFQMKSGEPIDRVVFHTPLGEGSDEAVGLRTRSRLILLRPTSMVLEEAGLQDPATRARIRYLRGLVESP